jgi:Dolichyl-phosphate-mannose-protein mannosyltransferase
MNYTQRVEPEFDSEPGEGYNNGYWFEAHSGLIAILVMIAAFLIRLRTARGTFLNPDEALHYLLANQSTWLLAYKASLTNAHPPLLTSVLYFWRRLGTSELILRLPSVLAGTAFCWIFFKWLSRIFGRLTGFIGLILVSFLPPLIALSAEVRQYALLIFFLAAAAYCLERALAENSSGMMLLSAIFLYLGLLTHYSAILFASAMGVYSLLRVIVRPSDKVTAAWIMGQAGAVGLVAALYVSHISKLKGDYAAGTIQGWLANSFFRPGHDNPFLFAFARTGGVFQYVFGQLAVGDIAYFAFIAAVILVWRGKCLARQPTATSHQLVILLVLPFFVGAAAAIARIYPYGGTRHSAFLIMFAVAGVSLAMAQSVKENIRRGMALAILVVAFCTAFGKPHRPYILREDQSRIQMTRGIEFIRSQIPPSELIFVDYQTRLLLGYYVCPEQPVPFAAAARSLEQVQCGNHRVVAAGPDVYNFTAETFLPRWNELMCAHSPKPGEYVWVIQAGWEVNLSNDLQRELPQFQSVNSHWFGKNIAIFPLPPGKSLPDSLSLW